MFISDENSTLRLHENYTHHGGESPEHSDHVHDEYMSPFLPDLDNDTFINSLHNDEHFVDHNIVIKDQEGHETTKPPSLEFDQLNHTNPYDNNTFDSLGVIPLTANNVTENSVTTTISSKSIETDNAVNMEKNKTEESLQEQSTPFSSLLNTSDNTLTESKTPKETESTLPPEILNNVHSNSFFEREFSKILNDELYPVEKHTSNETTTESSTKKEIIADRDTTSNNMAINTTTEFNKGAETTAMEEETTISADNIDVSKAAASLPNVQQPTEQIKETTTQLFDNTVSNTTNLNNFNEISSSTEDLLALETTTNNFKPVEKKNTFNIKEATTIHADTIEKVNSVVHFLAEDENDITNNKVTDFTTTSPDKTYEVQETVSDVTTTERLFISPKPVTNSTEEEDLTVEPLEKEIETNKTFDKKEISYRSFESPETSNDISDENQEKEGFKIKPVTRIDFDSKTAVEFSTISNLNTFTKESSNEKGVGFETVKPVTEDFVLPTFSRCSPGQFQCLNGTSVKDGSYCILNSDRCDSVKDCTDDSDEINCEKEGCPNNFQVR